ncbi:MAG: molecular chaperone TorD family protein [Burkholderiales bacterium]
MPTASAASDCLTSPQISAGGTSAKAEFFVCLARAFQPPGTPAARNAFAHDLAGDLAELAGEAGYELGPRLDRFAAHSVDAERQLLEDYSALFLVSPVPVPLNAGLYVDGGLLGRMTQAMLERYREAALEPDTHFHDLPDHVTMQLEYVAVMFSRAAEGDYAAAARAREFLDQFVLAWLPGFMRALRAASERIPAARAYGALAAILEATAQREAAAPGSE